MIAIVAPLSSAVALFSAPVPVNVAVRIPLIVVITTDICFILIY
jgi:hypothetical protein